MCMESHCLYPSLMPCMPPLVKLLPITLHVLRMLLQAEMGPRWSQTVVHHSLADSQYRYQPK